MESEEHPYICDTTIAGHLAMWLLRQHPYHSVEGVDAVTAALRERAKADGWEGSDELRLRRFEDWQAVERWLADAVYDHPQMTIWNTPRDHGTVAYAERHARGRAAKGGLLPEHDFVGIDALMRNTARSAWNEAEADRILGDLKPAA